LKLFKVSQNQLKFSDRLLVVVVDSESLKVVLFERRLCDHQVIDSTALVICLKGLPAGVV